MPLWKLEKQEDNRDFVYSLWTVQYILRQALVSGISPPHKKGWTRGLKISLCGNFVLNAQICACLFDICAQLFEIGVELVGYRWCPAIGHSPSPTSTVPRMSLFKSWRHNSKWQNQKPQHVPAHSISTVTCQVSGIHICVYLFQHIMSALIFFFFYIRVQKKPLLPLHLF